MWPLPVVGRLQPGEDGVFSASLSGRGGVPGAWRAPRHQPPTDTPTAEPTATAAPSETAAATETKPATETATTVPTPRPTTPPQPAYLPVTVKDPPCTPVEEHIDVVFVVDGSAYMRNVRRGKPAFQTALEMVRWSLDAMDFSAGAGGKVDQAGVVVFRHRLVNEESLDLTSSRASLNGFLGGLEYGSPADRTAMTEALDRARSYLNGRRHLPANKRVVVFISEMQAKRVPYEHIPECAAQENGQEECAVLRKAADLKADGIVVVVFATSTVGRAEEMMHMASGEDLAHVLPARDVVTALIKGLAPVTPCPKEMFWPLRP
jgi:Mg-chelatase subunit ChlD